MKAAWYLPFFCFCLSAFADEGNVKYDLSPEMVLKTKAIQHPNAAQDWHFVDPLSRGQAKPAADSKAKPEVSVAFLQGYFSMRKPDDSARQSMIQEISKNWKDQKVGALASAAFLSGYYQSDDVPQIFILVRDAELEGFA